MSRTLGAVERAHAERLLGRATTPLERSVLTAMWSEHCSYASSRRLLARLPRTGGRVVVGPGENAGVVDIGEGWVVVFKMESHNHPSFIEPYQGAATGVGGIVRDVVAMGARPVALLDSLRFGVPGVPRTRTLVRGAVAGIAGYGNAIGVPVVRGEARFDASYDGNCLVNVLCCGVARADALVRGVAAGVGNVVLYVGARTGRDGIHGATMASGNFGADALSQVPTVQVGDPFQGKLLLEACLDAFATGAVVGAQDMGAAGLTNASAEMASRGGTGVRIDLARVPRRQPGMTDEEVLLSESQERFLLVVQRSRVDEVVRCFARWEVLAVPIGEVTDDGVWRCVAGDAERVALPVEVLVRGAPERVRPMRAPTNASPLPTLTHRETWSGVLRRMMTQLDTCDAGWIREQYDRHVGTDTVLGPEADAARMRVKGADVHLALACEGNARHVALDPRSGAAGQVLACARALACVGAEAIGVTDGLNFGDPGDPEVLWALSEAIDGIAQACVALGVPVVSGNVSLHNQTGDQPVLPTPMIGMVGVLPTWVRRVPSSLPREGLTVALLSARASADPRAVALGGSLYLRAIHGLGRAGELAEIDLPGEVALHAALRRLVRGGAIEAARSVTDGGVAVALARFGLPAAGFGAPIGGAYVLSSGERTAATDVAFFGEGHGRALVAYAPDARAAVLRAAGGVHLLELGVARGDRLVVLGGADATIDVDVHELARAWARVLPEWLE